MNLGELIVSGAPIFGTSDNPRLVHTSHSIDNVFDYCPRKFEFLNLYDKRPPRDSGYAADVGTALHEATQHWLMALAEGASEEDALAQGFLQLAIHFPWAMESEQSTSVRSFDNCVLMFYEITANSEWHDWELVEVEGKGWAVEVAFQIRHTSIGPVYVKGRDEYILFTTQGKIDLIMRHKRTGKLRTIDIKTTALAKNLTRAEWEFSGQQIGYTHVLHTMMGEVPEQFEVVYCVARFSASERPVVQFIPMEKTPDDVDDYWMGKLDRLYRMKHYAEAGWFPRTNGGCHSWGHECPMFSICHSRDDRLINMWFASIEAEPQQGYDYWVTMEV